MNSECTHISENVLEWDFAFLGKKEDAFVYIDLELFEVAC